MGRKLTVYMIDGATNGPRTIEIGNWSGKAIYSPRAKLSELIKREEFDKPGIYILRSDPTKNGYNDKIYIGEAERVGDRLKQHLNNPDRDFSECIIFISKDEMLTKSHIKYLESRLVEIAVQAKNAEIENVNTPTKSSLSEADISDMEYFLEQIKLILPINGINALVANSIVPETYNKIEEQLKNDLKFYIKSKDAEAEMCETSEGYVVFKGSTATKQLSNSINKTWLNLREKLIDSENLSDQGNKYVFEKDTIFSSTSAASSIIMGRQSSGPAEWKTKSGKSYKEITEENSK